MTDSRTARTVWAGFRLELKVFRTSLGELAIVLAIPFLVVIFFSITRAAGRTDLDVVSLSAPCLAGSWTLGLVFASGLVEGDRFQGVVEATRASPAHTSQLVFGRCLGIGLCSAAGFVEAIVTAELLFQPRLPDVRAGFVVATAATVSFAVTGFASLLTGVISVLRSTMTLQNVLGYPVYLLGGIFAPTSALPDWLHPLSRMVYLSWASDAMRWGLGAAGPRPLGALAMVVLLGVTALVLGLSLEQRVRTRLRRTGGPAST